MEEKITYLVTLTDAIHDGQSWYANGCLVTRKNIELNQGHTDRKLWIEARKCMGYSGIRGRYLDDDTWMPYNSIMMLHVMLNDE